MSTNNTNNTGKPATARRRSEDADDPLRQNDVMAHLLDALKRGEDIGHYGRLVFAMVARHFMSDDDLVAHLAKCPGFGEEKARSLVHQVRQRDYNPPKREKILEWQKEQDFPICPAGEDPDGCNLYRNLKFPGDVYEKIEEYHEKKAEVEEQAAAAVRR
jgi:DNA primase large subunit